MRAGAVAGPGVRLQAERVERLCCASCGDVIGAYEPMLAILPDGSERKGSRLTLRSELEHPNSVALHERCHRSAIHGNAQ